MSDSQAVAPTLPPVARLPGADERMESLPNQEELEHGYRMLAMTLVTNEQAWTAYTARCDVIRATGLYGHKTAETVAIAGLKGMAMGMDFMRALATVKVIHGTPTIRGPQALAMIRERVPGAHIECKTSTDKRAVWELGRPGKPLHTYTRNIDDVPKDQRSRNKLWNTYTRRLLKWDCFSEGAQELFGDVLEGCYITEEIEGARGEEDDSPPAPPAVQAPATPAALGSDHPARQVVRELLNQATGMGLEARGLVPKEGDWDQSFTEDRRRLWDEVCQDAFGFVPDGEPEVTQEQVDAMRLFLKVRRREALLEYVSAKSAISSGTGRDSGEWAKTLETTMQSTWDTMCKQLLGQPVPRAKALSEAEVDQMIDNLSNIRQMVDEASTQTDGTT